MFKKAHGIEVLLRKASVDPEFRELLLAERGAAAKEIDLVLTPAEEGILATVPEADLVQMIEKIEVPEAHRAAFMGKTAAVMLAVVVGAGLVATCGSFQTLGARPRVETEEDGSEAAEPEGEVDKEPGSPGPTRGIRADPVEPKADPGGGK